MGRRAWVEVVDPSRIKSRPFYLYDIIMRYSLSILTREVPTNKTREGSFLINYTFHPSLVPRPCRERAWYTLSVHVRGFNYFCKLCLDPRIVNKARHSILSWQPPLPQYTAFNAFVLEQERVYVLL